MDKTISVSKVNNGFIIYDPDLQESTTCSDYDSLFEQIQKYFGEEDVKTQISEEIDADIELNDLENFVMEGE